MGSRGPGIGRHFRDFVGISGPEGPKDLWKGPSGFQFLLYQPKIRKNRKGGYRKLTFAHVSQAQRCVRCTF